MSSRLRRALGPERLTAARRALARKERHVEFTQFVSLGWLVALVVILVWIRNSLFVIKEWERGAVLRLGRMIPTAKGAGLRVVFWPIETLYRVPLRVVTLDVPPQDIITRDNV